MTNMFVYTDLVNAILYIF